MNLKTLLSTFAAATMAVSLNAHAQFPYGSVPSILPGGSHDPFLTQSKIDQAIVEGINAQGTAIPKAVDVTVDYKSLYQPELSNLRVLTVNIALRGNANVGGKTARVGYCSFSGASWRAGPNEQAHVSAMLDDMRSLGTTFAKSCFIKPLTLK